MIPLAHLGGVPLEELLPAIAGSGMSLLGARAWLNHQLRRHRAREPR